MRRVTTNIYLRKTLEKPSAGLRNLRTKVRELFMCGEGISTPQVRHMGRQPLIQMCKIMTSIFIYFPFLMFLYFWGQQEQSSCSYVSSIAMRNSDLRSSLKPRKLHIGLILNFQKVHFNR